MYWQLPGISPSGILQRILPLAEPRLLPGILRGEYIAASSQRQRSLQERLRSKEPLFIFDTSCLQIFFQRLLTACSYKKCPESLNQCRTDPLQIASCYPYGSDSPGRGKWSKCGIFFIFLKLCCDQTVRFFQLLSTVLKRFCPLDAKNVSVLVLAIFFDLAIFTVFTPNWRFLALFEVGIEPSCN